MSRVVDISTVIDTQPVGAFQLRVFLLCAAVLFVDGFDVQGITYVAPTLTQEWGLVRGELWPALTAGLVGVMLGALGLAPLADHVGRRRVIVYSCAAFGIGSLLTIFVDSLPWLTAVRFVTGLGLGSALPNAIGLASEYAPRARRALIVMFVGSGISLGAIGAGVAAARLLEPFGWRVVFVLGGVLPLALAALLARALPESIRLAAVTPRLRHEAERLLRRLKPEIAAETQVEIVSSDAEGGRATVADLFADGRGLATVCLWVAFFMSLLNVYLAINWLPTSLAASGFSVTQAAEMTTLYHVGGVLGTYAIGLTMDRLGAHRMVLVALLLAILGFYTFATGTGLGQWSTTAILALAGVGVIGAQVGVTALAAITYPVAMRATGLGWALGIGRVGSIVGPTIGGIMLTTAADPRSVYLGCIIPVLVGMAAVALLKRQAAPARAPAAAT
ncbi:MAG TPA: MFS transporter [Gammaproteobacteria bacterium]|nr:MFS transporter [Gammaproteobacteria bacterium]